MIRNDPEVALEALETFAHGLDHPEGITLTPNGDIFVGGEAGQIYAIGHDDSVTQVASTGGFNLGLAADGEDRLYVCDTVARTVWRVTPASGERNVFSAGLPDRPMLQPNWGCFDARGNYYVTDSGHWGRSDGLVWVVRPGGTTEVWTEELTAFPNGCAVSPDGSRLFVAESFPSAIVEVPIGGDGKAGSRRVLQELGAIVPDGVAVASDGRLVIACYRPDSIFTWDVHEGLELLASDPRGTVLAAPTNVVFTGPDLGTLVVPNLGRWHLTRGRLGVQGTPLFYPTAAQIGS